MMNHMIDIKVLLSFICKKNKNLKITIEQDCQQVSRLNHSDHEIQLP